jgi:hypothetical protein
VSEVSFIPARTIGGRIEGVFVAPGDGVRSEAVPELILRYDGAAGDRHAGLTRSSGSREPWYGRGTVMRNERQLSLVSAEDLAEIAVELGMAELKPEWIGANLLLSGIPHFSLLPPRTILMFEGGASVRIDGDNGPCRSSGRSIAAHLPDRPDVEFSFVKAGLHRRGLVGWVEREGVVRPGTTIKARIWEQHIYPGG